MDDQSPKMEKLRTIKNQINISLKAIEKSKEFIHFSNSLNAL